MRANGEVLYRHAEDAAFLWKRRQVVLRSTIKHTERVRLDHRIEAHLDALSAAGGAGLEAALDLTRGGCRVGAIFAASVLMLGRPCDTPAAAPWLEAASRPTGFAEVVSAIGWSDASELAPLLAQWLASLDPWLGRLGLAGLGVHRRHPGAALADALRHPDAALRATAANVAGQLGVVNVLPALRELAADVDPRVRLAAARSAARFGDVAAQDTLLALVEGGAGFLAEAAASSLGLLDARDAVALVRRWAFSRCTPRLAIVLAEALGEPELVPLLIGWMSDDELARRAGDAFAAITGVDLAEEDLVRPRPAIVPGDPTEDPDDPRVELGPDHAMPFPAPLKVAAWWRAHAGRFAAQGQYLAGEPVGVPRAAAKDGGLANLMRIARTGPPRCQALASTKLAMTQATLPTIETHAPATWRHVLPGQNVWIDAPARIPSSPVSSKRRLLASMKG